ncbi:MAG: copper chaperone PCu(A)C [Rhodospirillales bacterium]|nr:MAG: copper chaperone PCu(A)C [Rhodospirillales bacterium]
MTHPRRYSRRAYNRTLGLAAAALVMAAIAVPATAGEVEVRNPTAHVMEDPVNGRRIEVYMEIENWGAARDRLYAVRSKLGRKTMLAVVDERDHAMGKAGHDGSGHSAAAMHMQTRVLDIPAGATTTLQHGMSHIMLMEPKKALAVGEHFPVTLFFERAGRVSVDVTVVPTGMGH